VVPAAVARVARIAAQVAEIVAEDREETGVVPVAIVIAGVDLLATAAAKARPTWISRS
jgi:hypothetical protein